VRFHGSTISEGIHLGVVQPLSLPSELISVSLGYPPLGVNDGAAYKADWQLLDQDRSRRYALAERVPADGPSRRAGRTYRASNPRRRRPLALVAAHTSDTVVQLGMGMA